MIFVSIKKWVRLYLNFIDKSIYIIFKLLFKIENNLIIFEGSAGNLNDSCWVLYDYLKKSKKYKFVWMVKDPNKYLLSKDTIFVNRFHFSFNIKADYYYSKAAFSFYTHTTSHIKYKRKGQKTIFIGHGFAFKGNKGHGKSYHNFDYALSIGQTANQSQAKFIGCPEEKMIPLGLPRNDLLLKSKSNGKANPWNKGFNKIILWMPTFRESYINYLSEMDCATETGLPLISDASRLKELDLFLQNYNIGIILKPHPIQIKKTSLNIKMNNIIIINDNDIEARGLKLYEMMGMTDALLTDYSSVSIDYTLLDKPIGYILSDIELYKKDRGFAVTDPTILMPGHHIFKIEDLLSFIEDVGSDKDPFREQRAKTTLQIHAARNGNSCELIRQFFNL